MKSAANTESVERTVDQEHNINERYPTSVIANVYWRIPCFILQNIPIDSSSYYNQDYYNAMNYQYYYMYNQTPNYPSMNSIPPERPKETSRNYSSTGYKIFVGGLHPEVTDADLMTYFSQFGTVLHVYATKSC